jgi:3-oxoacyl-[acyl-carrier protein] reductase
VTADLSGHVALVTGANHGIGRATAELLAARGASVVVSYLRTEFEDPYPDRYQRNRRFSGGQVAREIAAVGGRAHAIEADLLDADVIPALFDEAAAQFGDVDILINNATGHFANDSFANRSAVEGHQPHSVTAEIFDRTLGVDARAGALLIAEFARRYIARDASWGRIIGLTSGGPAGFPGQVTYGAAKAALENYTMSASIELGGLGVTANMIYPPVTDTGWVTDEVIEFVRTSDHHIHVARPEDVAEAIAFLCSDDARMITGNIIRMR